MLRILQVATPGTVGGLERVVQLLARGLHQRGHDLRVMAVLDRSGVGEAFLEPLEAAGVPLHVIRSHPRNYPGEMLVVRRLIRSFAPLAVHTHGPRADVLDAWVARRQGLPTVTTVHGASRMGGRSTFYEWVQDRSYRAFDAVVAVSDPLRHDLIHRLGVAPARIWTIPNAWPDDIQFLPPSDARDRLGLPDDAVPVLGWVGRLIRIKAADTFLRALSHLRDRRWRAVLVGDGPERAGLTELARTLGIQERVTFAGTIVQAAALFRGFDLFVLSSRSEGTPVVLLEAMAAGVPSIGTRVGGLPALLGEGAGLLVPPDAPEALASALQAALDDPEGSIARAIVASQRLSQGYGRDLFLDRYESMYREVIDGARLGPVRPA